MTKKIQFPRGKIVFLATGNIYKFNEVRRILAKYGLSTALVRLKKTEIQDKDIENIAKNSAIDAAKKCNLPIIVEDAGLFIEALNGFPGPYTAYVYQTLGTEGVLKLMRDCDKRDAFFRSVVSFCDLEEDVLKCFPSTVYGRIAHEEHGRGGFDFDSLFIPSSGRGNTFAEMSIDEKNKHSHRAEAFRKYATWYVSKSL